MISEHSILPPSSASRRKQCSASRKMEAEHGVTWDDEEAKIGTASHELAARMVAARAVANLGYPKPEDVIGRTASNGVVWDQDSYDGAEMYADDIAKIMQDTRTFTPEIEQRVDIPRIHPESWGTPDNVLYARSANTIYLHDYKYGHRPVEVFENWQMIEYAVGKIDELVERGLSDWNIKLVITIVQPRASHRDGPIRRWTVQGSDLRAYANIANGFEFDAMADDAECRTGSECRDCSARHVCPALQEAGGAVMDFISKSIPVNLQPGNLATEITLLRRAAELVKARLSGLEAQAEGSIQLGQAVPGYRVEQGYGRQKWSVPVDEVFAMCDLLGVDIRKPAEPVTPKQAIKLGVDESVINAYSITPRTSAKLVESSKTIASAIFSKRT